MPNKTRVDKRSGSRNRATQVAKPLRSPDSVKAVLKRATPTLTRVCEQATRQGFWKEWLARHVPAELIPRLSGVVERDDTLVIFAESAAWSARLRYVLQEVEAEIKQEQPTIQRVSVRVMPRA